MRYIEVHNCDTCPYCNKKFGYDRVNVFIEYECQLNGNIIASIGSISFKSGAVIDYVPEWCELKEK